MAQQKRKRSKKWISTLIFILLLVAAGVVCYFVWDAYFRDRKTPEPDNNTVVVDDKTKGAEEKKDNNKESEEKYKEKEETQQYEGTDPNSNEYLTGAVTHAKVSGDKVIIRVNIDQYLSGGTCELRIKNNGSEVYSDSASIIDSASTSTCEGFNVPLDSVPAGYLDILITLNSGEKTGSINGMVEVNK